MFKTIMKPLFVPLLRGCGREEEEEVGIPDGLNSVM
jgi:hypothetical protein